MTQPILPNLFAAAWGKNRANTPTRWISDQDKKMSAIAACLCDSNELKKNGNQVETVKTTLSARLQINQFWESSFNRPWFKGHLLEKFFNEKLGEYNFLRKSLTLNKELRVRLLRRLNQLSDLIDSEGKQSSIATEKKMLQSCIQNYESEIGALCKLLMLSSEDCLKGILDGDEEVEQITSSQNLKVAESSFLPETNLPLLRPATAEPDIGIDRSETFLSNLPSFSPVQFTQFAPIHPIHPLISFPVTTPIKGL